MSATESGTATGDSLTSNMRDCRASLKSIAGQLRFTISTFSLGTPCRHRWRDGFLVESSRRALRYPPKERLDTVIAEVNAALRGADLTALRPTLERNGRGGRIPHWFEELSTNGTLPNLDGKSIGSIIEMLLIAVLETKTFRSVAIPPLRVNPARGVDLPDLDLGIKSPSENYCTSEPLFSAYERLNGSEYDALVLLTDYQDAKSKPPLKLQIIQWRGSGMGFLLHNAATPNSSNARR